jgi:HNH endonuclease
MDAALVRAVWRRAGNACEYCRMPRASYPVPYALDHVIARQHGGSDALSNLALACLHCNGHKGPNIAGIDPRTRKLTLLFNPRRHGWDRHFRWQGALLEGRIPVGRTTVRVLAMNDRPLLELREALLDEGTWPPSG